MPEELRSMSRGSNTWTRSLEVTGSTTQQRWRRWVSWLQLCLASCQSMLQQRRVAFLQQRSVLAYVIQSITRDTSEIPAVQFHAMFCSNSSNAHVYVSSERRTQLINRSSRMYSFMA